MLITQISDFHLKSNGALAYGAADTAGALEKVVEHINQMNPLPDLVIATGDLADGGSPQSYGQSWLQRSQSWFAKFQKHLPGRGNCSSLLPLAR